MRRLVIPVILGSSTILAAMTGTVSNLLYRCQGLT